MLNRINILIPASTNPPDWAQHVLSSLRPSCRRKLGRVSYTVGHRQVCCPSQTDEVFHGNTEYPGGDCPLTVNTLLSANERDLLSLGYASQV